MSTRFAAVPRAASLAGFALPLPRDKADTLLLLGSAVMVLAPHAVHLPLWISALCAITLLWRAAITLRGKRMPPATLLVPVAIAAMAGVLYNYGTLLGRDPGVAMLVLLVAFKMLEMRARRDLFVVVFLCLFLLLTSFFYSQTMLSALLAVASVVALLTTQLSFQYTGRVPPLRQRLLLSLRIVCLAAPLALALYLLFPRIQGPLWGSPDETGSGRVGLSDQMSPGSLSHLAQSGEPAFRVKFLDPPPPHAERYWRAIVLGAFDGRTWSRVRPQSGPQQPAVSIVMRGEPVRYQLTLEPSDSRWLPALEIARALPDIGANRASMSPELEMSATHPIAQRVRYDIASFVRFRLQADADLAHREQWLALPPGGNPRALEAGRALRSMADPVERIRTVLDRFTQEPFAYTLDPPLLGVDPVDAFLFVTRAGFCEHYAGAFVFLMRAAGVPARVVTGYQGGELNPVDGYLTVSQSDAHAWAEVWLPGRGWLRIDPTAAVAPERVQRGVASALRPRAPFGLEGLGRLIDFNLGPHSWLAQFRFQLSALNNGWNQWMLNYTPERQQGLLDRLKTPSFLRQALLLLGCGCAVVLLRHILRTRRQTDPVDALYFTMCKRLGQLGLARAPGEGPNAYARRVAGPGLTPAGGQAAIRFLHLYSGYKYSPATPGVNLVATLKSLLAQIR